MIFKTFNPNEDITAGRTTRIASGFWPDGITYWSQSLLVDDFWSMTGSSATPSPSYGSSLYDIRRTMYYVNVYPDQTHKDNNDPYFSCTFGSNVGSGSFGTETGSIYASPTKAIYSQYKNMLLGTSDLDGMFSFKTGSSSGTTDAYDIFVLAFSTYKMKDRIDEGIFEISFKGSKGTRTYVDDSSTETQVKTVYNLITGSLEAGIIANAAYDGVGLLYPQNGILVINASKLDEAIGLTAANFNSEGGSYSFNYITNQSTEEFTQNQKVIFESIRAAGNEEKMIKIRKSEYVPARHYFVRVKNRDFNYSNNPTYVYDGTDTTHAKGTIRNDDFIDDPKTYPTTVGLYNDNNELVAVAKLSRPAVKSFSNELLIKIRLDF